MNEPEWREVSKDEFYKAMNCDVHPSIQPGKWPYTSLWMTPVRQILGKSVGYLPTGSGLEQKKYYLPKN